MITHDEASELLASYALDAVDANEAKQIEQHLSECPRCRAELDANRDVAAALGNSVDPLPEGLWAGIVSRLPERHDEEPPPMPRLVPERAAEGAVVTELRPRKVRAGRGRVTTLASLVVAAAAVAAVLGINLVRADNQVDQYKAAIGSSAVVTALETPGHQIVNLTSTSHAKLAQFVVVPGGRGYLVSSSLPGLASDHTYQLWGLIGNQPISLGLLGTSPSQSTFTMGNQKPERLSITIEPSGGSVVPTGPIVASGMASGIV